MEHFNTLSDKLINFYAHRFFVAEDRLSWAVVYTDDGDGRDVALAVLNIKDADYYIDIERDSVCRKLLKNHDSYWFNLVDAWLCEEDKKLHHRWESGDVVSVCLDTSAYRDLHKYDIPFDYDMEYKPEMSVKGTLEQIYSLDFFAYRNQIDKKLLQWGVAEIIEPNGNTYYLPIITIDGLERIALYIERGCCMIDFKEIPTYYLHSAKLQGRTLQFTNSLGEPSACSELDMLCAMANYQEYVELQIDELLRV